jgi:hypothetical protein
VDCNDNNECTIDACSGGTCTHLPATGPCDDGNECSFDDACVAGVCRGARCPTGTICCDLGSCVPPSHCH